MIPKEIKKRYSCSRKSDFVTYFAICFFFVVVVLELYLILWVPIQLRREGVLQKHVAKEKMSNTIDYYRQVYRKVPTANSLNEGEVALARNMLDLYANYIRKYQDRLELPEILEIIDLLKRYGVFEDQWREKKFVFVKSEISLSKSMELIEKKNNL